MNPQDAQKNLEELKRLAAELNYVIPQDWLADPLSKSNEILETFIKWDDELKEIKKDLSGLNSILKENLQDLTKSNVQLNQARKATRELTSISQTLLNDRKSIAELDKKSIEKLIQRTKISNDLLQQSIQSGNLAQEELTATENNLLLGQQLLGITQERLELEEQIIKKMGLAPAIADGINKSLNKLGFGGLANQLKLDEAILKTKEFVKANDGNVTAMETFGVFTKEVGKSFAGIFSSANLIQLSLGLIIKAAIAWDEMASSTAKQMGISYEEASKINSELTNIAAQSSNTFVTTKALVEAQNSLNTSLGTNAQFSGDILTNFTELTKQAGYSVEASTTLSKLSLINNKSSKDLATTYLGQVKSLNLKNGLAINEKALLNDISNVSKGTLATFSKNPEQLAKAAFEAKKVGLALKEIEGIQGSLLDIELSISSEFEAEVLTGKSLNLERARYYALTNDIAGLAQEINKQGITTSTFSKQNVIQQEATAKALGMSRDELGNMLIEQEAISHLSGVDGKNAKEKFDNLVKQVGLEEAKKRLGNDQLAQQLASTSTQERFVALTEKLQELFIGMAGPIMDVVSPLIDLVSTIFTPISWISEKLAGWGESLSNVLGPLGSVGKLLKGIAMLAVGFAAYSAFASLSAIPIVGPVLGGVAAASIIAAGTSFIGSIKDGQIDPDGGLMVSGPKGSIQLDKEDTFIGNKNGIIAGTDLGGKKENSIQPQNNDSSIGNLANTLGSRMDIMINKLDTLIQSVDRGMTVNLDGNKVSQELLTPLAISNRRI